MRRYGPSSRLRWSRLKWSSFRSASLQILDKQQPEFTPEADAELQACLAWLRSNDCRRIAELLHEHRRPKPPELTLGRRAAIAFDVLAGKTVIPREQREVITEALGTLMALEDADDK